MEEEGGSQRCRKRGLNSTPRRPPDGVESGSTGTGRAARVTGARTEQDGTCRELAFVRRAGRLVVVLERVGGGLNRHNRAAMAKATNSQCGYRRREMAARVRREGPLEQQTMRRSTARVRLEREPPAKEGLSRFLSNVAQAMGRQTAVLGHVHLA
ncbi:hypothetical protein CKAH01_04145 [Colletotrichum kahawae]|uniref:Uncharacterized protein n=1 Tax=Colletotrichum kahawae TaxID=34407 RepID=A0AAD9YMN7_COLKA|nr:hypothetical protein CKAH01_04145 [Colletotrichum kahawae]